MPAQRESPLPIIALDSGIAARTIEAEALPPAGIVFSGKIPEIREIKTAVLKSDAGVIQGGTLTDVVGDKERKSLEERFVKASQTVSNHLTEIELPSELKGQT